MSGEQTRASLGELSPGVAVPSRRTKKGGTQTQGINLLPLVLKWLRVAGILLAIWLVGYFGFNLTWVLVAELGYVGYAVYRGKKKAVASRAISMEEDEPVLARVDELPAWVIGRLFCPKLIGLQTVGCVSIQQTNRALH